MTWPRGVRGGLSVGLVAAALVAVPVTAQARSCLVRNTDTGAVSSTLQGAVNSAHGGQKLRVHGRCSGARVDKPLTIVGERTDGRPESILTAGRTGPVLRIRVDSEQTVVVAELVVTGGVADQGGGIRARSGNVVLRGSYLSGNNAWAAFVNDDLTMARGSQVIRNVGGVQVRGHLTMNGTSRVAHNGDVGVWARASWQMTMNGSASVSENPGTGILNFGSIVMNDRSSVFGNGTGIATADRWATSTTLHDHSSVHDNLRSGIETTFDGDVVLDGSSSVYGNGDTGIRVLHSGDITLNDASTVWGNTGSSGGGIYGSNRVTLNDETSVWGNLAETGGGVASDGSITLNGSASVVDNAAAHGGGILLGDPRNDVEVHMHDQAVVSGNTAELGAGVYNTYLVQMDGSSTITGNTATVAGGGVYNVAGATVTVADSAAVVGNLPDDIA